MRVRWLLVFTLLVTLLGNFGVTRATSAASANAAPAPAVATCTPYPQTSGATWKICLPADWDLNQVHNVVVLAHGYVIPGDPLTYQDTLADGTGTPMADIITGLGAALITSTYPRNGLVVLDAKADLVALVNYFTSLYPKTPTRKVYLAGFSMGGLIAAQLAEENTGKFDGALVACGIVGNFRREINYWGNFNLLYRAMFPGVVASPPVSTTTSITWTTTYSPSIRAAASANITATQQLLTLAKAAVVTDTYTTTLQTGAATLEQLAYFSFLSAEESAIRLGGNPFGNRGYWYWGSSNDLYLNRHITRVTASPTAVLEMQKYDTTGKPTIPVVAIHTTLDPVVPVGQSLLYYAKSRLLGNTNVTPLLAAQYGHCSFTQAQVLEAFGVLMSKVTGGPLASLQAASTFMSPVEMAAEVQKFTALEAVEAAQQLHVLTTTYLPLVVR